MILYLISGRSFFSRDMGRKLSEVCTCFQTITDVEVICGGDISKTNEVVQKSLPVASSEYHSKWYRKNRFVNFFVRSISELKDIYHTYVTYSYICKNGKKYELIWERSSRLHWAGILYAKKHNIPCVLEWKDHLIDYKYSLFRPLALYIEKWKNANADYIAVESNVLKQQLISEGVDGDKIYITYNAVNPDEFVKNIEDGNKVRQDLGFNDTDIVVGYAGSYAFYHDSIRMIKAAEILRDKGINNIKWLLLGNGKDKAMCEKYAIEKGLLNKNVFMLPFQPKEKIPYFLSAMDVAILPGSTDIICPIKVMEYMAAETVVMVPDYLCNREIINEGNGLLFTPFDEISIVSELCKVADNKEKCLFMGKNARETVVNFLTWDKTYGKILQNILEKSPRIYGER